MPSYPVLSSDDEAGLQAAVVKAREVLDDGGVVALPTETVYGLFCRSSSTAARDRIYRLKERDLAKPLPFVIGARSQVFNFVNDLPVKAERLARRYWPGPLTLVLGPDPGIALRFPDHPLTTRVLRGASGPVQATSANRSGENPATSASEVVAAIPEGIDLLVDGGPCARGAASAVVRVEDCGRWQILRDGDLPEGELFELLKTRIVLVCTGNTCRSPMAAALLRDMLSRSEARAPDLHGAFEVESAGVMAADGFPISVTAADALRDAGIPVSDAHRTRALTDAIGGAADRLLVMTRSHLRFIREQFPELEGRTALLDPDGEEIADPVGGGIATYRDCLAEIRQALDRRLGGILESGPAS